MTRNGAFKRAARARMAETGENYMTAARAVRKERGWTYQRFGDRRSLQGIDLPPAEQLELIEGGGNEPLSEDLTAQEERLPEPFGAIIACGARSRFVLPMCLYRQGDRDPVLHESLDIVENEGDQGKAYRLLRTEARRQRTPEIDSWAHLGAWALQLDRDPDKALTYYRRGVTIGELCFPEEFGGEISWGNLENRPFLRCLHGLGLTRWHRGETEAARAIFSSIAWLNPSDNQGVRYLLADIAGGREQLPLPPSDADLFKGWLDVTDVAAERIQLLVRILTSSQQAPGWRDVDQLLRELSECSGLPGRLLIEPDPPADRADTPWVCFEPSSHPGWMAPILTARMLDQRGSNPSEADDTVVNEIINLRDASVVLDQLIGPLRSYFLRRYLS